MQSGLRTDKPRNTGWTLSRHLALSSTALTITLHTPFPSLFTTCKARQLGRWVRPQQQARNIYCHWIRLIPALCVLADGLRPLPLGTGGNNSTSSWGIWATFCRNIFSRAWAMRTMSSVGCRKNTSLCSIIHILEAERFKSKALKSPVTLPFKHMMVSKLHNKQTSSSTSLHATLLLFHSGLACNNHSL